MKLYWHDIGTSGDRYPFAIRELTHARGVYVIRDKSTKKVLYVGSSANRLYSTATRHFQDWRRNKKWWSGAYGAQHDPGTVYQRAKCELAVEVMEKKADHLKREAELIERLEPRDNLVQRPDGGNDGEVPF